MATPFVEPRPPNAVEPSDSKSLTLPKFYPAGPRVIDGFEFQALLSLKRRTIWPMLGSGMTFFLAILMLAGFARPLMSEKLVGALNLGYALVLAVYVMCWGLAILYAFVADTRFDPQAARAVAEREVRS